MDNLARNCMLAKQAGMSYGKWKALQPIVPYEKKEVIPEGWIKCEYCGNPFKPAPRQRFCEMYCRQQAYAERKLEKQREYYHKRQKERKGNRNE